MNRLIIIGNGFDLAHGLPTRYKDFIDFFWKNIRENYKKEDCKKLIEINKQYDHFLFETDINSYSDFKKSLSQYCIKNKFVFYEKDLVAQRNGNDFVRIKNTFLNLISQKNNDNWVEIENEYYRQLKKILKDKPIDSFNIANQDEWDEGLKKRVEVLNNEFEEIKILFEEYLFKEVENSFEINNKEKGKNDWTKFYHLLKPISLSNNEHNILLEFNDKLDKENLNKFLNKQSTDKNIVHTRSLILNFNYTSTLNKYINSFKEGEIDVSLNQIHGKINDLKNIINFGFGDEMDEDYKAIENINENKYLRSFKSFQYLQNSNFSNLLSFIDSENFQVLIMGHSCGLSDRTLLNTIFEHNNCRSIKVFYHQKEDGSDNYTEIIQNISRHFNKKKLMREKIVNKTLCQPLPQIQLLKKI
ncbi:AbiH family protein [Flavobacterium sp.]